MYFINVALDSSNWIKICVDPSSRTLESCLLMSLWLFCWWLWQSLCLVYQVCPKITFCSCWNVWISPEVNTILFQLWILLILLSWCSFQSHLVNLMKSCQILAVSTNVSSSLRNLIKPKKSEKYSRSFVWKVVSKASYVLVVLLRK